MDKYNFHIPTKRYSYAVGEYDEYVISVINNNYKISDISDHCPYRIIEVNKLIKDNNMNIIDVEELLKRIGGAKNERTV